MTLKKSTVPVVIVSGYLGAGKTTFLNHLLSKTSQRIAVIVNDFGSINIDVALISSQHGDTIELTNGCVCCAIGSSLADAMLDISDREVQPDLVVIEASGVADPTSVSAYAHLGGFHLAGILTFIDAENALTTAKDTLVGETFWRQVDAADLLLITKSDIVTSAMYQEVRTAIHERQPNVPTAMSTEMSASDLMDMTSTFDSQSLSHRHTAQFNSYEVDTSSCHTIDDLRDTMTALPTTVVRAKGVVAIDGQPILVQLVGTRVTMTSTSISPTGIIAISAD